MLQIHEAAQSLREAKLKEELSEVRGRLGDATGKVMNLEQHVEHLEDKLKAARRDADTANSPLTLSIVQLRT